MLVKLLITLASAICGLVIFVVFRRMPTKWLLDYNEDKIDNNLIDKQNIPFFPYALVTAASCVSVAWVLIVQSGNIFNSISIFIISIPLLLIILADFRTRIIPDQFVVALLPCAILLWLSDGPEFFTLLVRIAAGLAAGLLLAFAGWAGSRLMKQEAMGMGDVKLLAAAGFAAGIPGILMVIVLSFLVAAIPAIFLLIRRNSREDQGSLAFGPFIAVSLIIVLLFDDKLLAGWQWWLESAMIF